MRRSRELSARFCEENDASWARYPPFTCAERDVSATGFAGLCFGMLLESTGSGARIEASIEEMTFAAAVSADFPDILSPDVLFPGVLFPGVLFDVLTDVLGISG